jgi:hypothetical protein
VRLPTSDTNGFAHFFSIVFFIFLGGFFLFFSVKFFKFEAHQKAITICRELSHPTQQVKKNEKIRQTTISICRGLSHPTGWAALPSENISGFFSMVEKPLII